MVETLQHPFELEALLSIYILNAPKRILEIGVWEGGTLQYWLSNPTPPGALGKPAKTVVVIDDEMRGADEWQEWARREGTTLELLHGRSQDQAIVEAARRSGPYDWLFIDADHRYEAGKADWENYAPMVAEGGLLVFHDIRRYEHGDLDRLWDEIKADQATLEIHDRTGEDWGGIGVVWM